MYCSTTCRGVRLFAGVPNRRISPSMLSNVIVMPSSVLVTSAAERYATEKAPALEVNRGYVLTATGGSFGGVATGGSGVGACPGSPPTGGPIGGRPQSGGQA